MSGLGFLLFEALDYGCKREEQNVLSPDLEQMIDLMTAGEFSLSLYFVNSKNETKLANVAASL